jgi:hypothetical protein
MERTPVGSHGLGGGLRGCHASLPCRPHGKPKAHCIASQIPIPSTLHATALPSSRPIANMLRAATRLAPSLIPRAEAALGTRSMSLAGMKGESQQPDLGVVLHCFSLPPLTPFPRSRL